MMRKKLWLVLLSGLFFISARAQGQQEQRFFAGGGLTIYGLETFTYPVGMIQLRYNYKELGKMSSSSVKLGMGLTFQSINGYSFFFLDLPASVDINIGHGSIPSSEFPVGAYAGLGFQSTYLPINLEQIWLYGPRAHVGLRARILRRSYFVSLGLQIANSKDYEPFEMLHLTLGSELF